jgi:hypothetical protein
MTEMRMRYVYAGIGVLVLAAALAIPALAQRTRGGPGPGMMGFGWGNQAPTPVTSIDTAAARARDALAATGYGDLAVAEVMEFSNHFYVLVKEKSTGIGALELLVERNGFVHPEYGPAMMWNTKYGHMAGFGGRGMMAGRRMGGGRMGGPGYGPGQGPGYGPGTHGPATPAAQPAITQERAKQIAGQYLTQAVGGTTPDEGTALYGYFTFDAERSGKPVGMLSVNAYTGQVWFHNWHGTFVQEKDF